MRDGLVVSLPTVLYCKGTVNEYLLCPFSSEALDKNEALEFERNRERFQFLKVCSASDPDHLNKSSVLTLSAV